MKVCVDMGASSTRYLEAGEIEPGEFPNDYKIVPLDHRIRDKTSENQYENLDLTIERINVEDSQNLFNEEDKNFPVRLMIGEMGRRDGGRMRQPHSGTPKHLQKINWYSALTAVALKTLSRAETEIPKKETTVDLYLAFPPAEVLKEGFRDFIEEVLLGDFRVTFHTLNRKVEMTINSVTAKEESLLAVAAYLSNLDGTLTERGEEFAQGRTTVLSIDIGASTTNLSLVKANSNRESGSYTISIGGNQVRNRLGKHITAAHAFTPTDETLADAAKTGFVENGKDMVDVSKELIKAKQEVADSLEYEIQKYFESVDGLNSSAVQIALVSGGGSMPSTYKGEQTTEPLAVYLRQVMDENPAWNTDVDFFSEKSEIYPRYANLMGLKLTAMRDSRRG